MKPSNTLGVLISLLQIGSIILFGVTMITMVSVLQTTLIAAENGITVEVDEASGEIKLSLEALPINNGYISADLIMSLGAMDEIGEYLFVDSENIILEAGSKKPVRLEIVSSRENLEPYLKGVSAGYLEMKVEVRTLNRLVGFSNTLLVRGGQ